MDGYGVLQDRFSVYKGALRKNEAHGFGISVFENGDHYVGEWVEGKMQGPGCYVTAKG